MTTFKLYWEEPRSHGPEPEETELLAPNARVLLLSPVLVQLATAVGSVFSRRSLAHG